jgi:UDP-N-acetylglucosamine acyltransferase
VFSFASVGEVPQDLKYAGERTRLVVGARCRIRENATLHLGTEGGGGVTRVGDDCLIMAGAHVGHDAQIGNRVILANYAGVAGHVVIGDNVIVGASAGLHQFIRVGEGAMIGALTRVTHDVMPFGLVSAADGTLQGLNLIGLKRRGMSREDIAALRAAYKLLAEGEGALAELAERIGQETSSEVVAQVARFFSEASQRSFLRPT